MKLDIRSYREGDESALKHCIAELQAGEGIYDPDYRKDEESVQELFDDITKDKQKGGEILVADSEGTIIGFVSLAMDNKNDHLIVKDVPTVYISDLGVNADHRGQGIGKQLLDAADKFAQIKKVKYIKLIVYTNNPAGELYAREGFKDYEKTMIKEVSNSD